MKTTATYRYNRQTRHHDDKMLEPLAAKSLGVQLVAFGWPVLALCWIFAQAAPTAADLSGIDRLLELGAIGAVLAVIMWQQFLRDKRLAQEVAERETRMADRITTLEERDREDLANLRADNEKQRSFIQEQLMVIVREHSQNVSSCHHWRDEARESLVQIRQDIKGDEGSGVYPKNQ